MIQHTIEYFAPVRFRVKFKTQLIWSLKRGYFFLFLILDILRLMFETSTEVMRFKSCRLVLFFIPNAHFCTPKNFTLNFQVEILIQ